MPTILGPAAQALKQCQNCYKAETPESRLLSCSACSRSHYCSKECQKAHWPSHKKYCKLNAETRKQLKAAPKGDHNAKDTAARLKKWIQMHRPILYSSIIHALSLQREPDACLTQCLALVLTPNFITSSKSSAPKDIAHSFLVSDAIVMPLAETREAFLEHHPSEQVEGLDAIISQSRTLMERGGGGVPIMVIHVPEVGLMHITPFGLEEVMDEESLPWNPSWLQDLKEVVRRGIYV